ncbi:MAG: hypothetical protein V3V08_15175 [Nannocystaceae bacterium]
MLKHFNPYVMPPCSRDEGYLFVNDSQKVDPAKFTQEFTAWADLLAPADVGFQIGYDEDIEFWTDGDGDWGNAMVTTLKNAAGVFWVDFTVKEVFP